MKITKEEYKKIKEEIFNDSITKEEKDKIIKQINNEINEIIDSIKEESDPIDE